MLNKKYFVGLFSLLLVLSLVSAANQLSAPTGINAEIDLDAYGVDGDLDVDVDVDTSNLTVNSDGTVSGNIGVESDVKGNVNGQDVDSSSSGNYNINANKDSVDVSGNVKTNTGESYSFGQFYNRTSNMTKEQIRAQLRENTSVQLSNGRNVTIKIMPDTASERAIERLGELNFSISIKEVENGENVRLTYEFLAEKEAKLLFIFNKKMEVSANVDVETGAVKTHKPFWAILANE